MSGSFVLMIFWHQLENTYMLRKMNSILHCHVISACLLNLVSVFLDTLHNLQPCFVHIFVVFSITFHALGCMIVSLFCDQNCK